MLLAYRLIGYKLGHFGDGRKGTNLNFVEDGIDDPNSDIVLVDTETDPAIVIIDNQKYDGYGMRHMGVDMAKGGSYQVNIITIDIPPDEFKLRFDVEITEL